MATPCAPLPKRPRFSPYLTVQDADTIKILRSAQDIPFPWEQSMPEKKYQIGLLFWQEPTIEVLQ